jgi:hypothetical protein
MSIAVGIGTGVKKLLDSSSLSRLETATLPSPVGAAFQRSSVKHDLGEA